MSNSLIRFKPQGQDQSLLQHMDTARKLSNQSLSTPISIQIQNLHSVVPIVTFHLCVPACLTRTAARPPGSCHTIHQSKQKLVDVPEAVHCGLPEVISTS